MNAMHDHDPRGLILDSLNMPELSEQECRSIFLDWLISDYSEDKQKSANALFLFYKNDYPDHPMMGLLEETARSALKTKPMRRKRNRSAENI